MASSWWVSAHPCMGHDSHGNGEMVHAVSVRISCTACVPAGAGRRIQFAMRRADDTDVVAIGEEAIEALQQAGRGGS